MIPPDESSPPSESPVLIIGAGLAGLTAARVVAESGQRVHLIEGAERVGGRLATTTIGDAVFDHGAQFFTTRSPAFTDAVAGWLERGLVEEWCRGFESEPDGHPRYRAVGGMQSLAAALADDLDPDLVTMSLGHPIGRLRPSASGWDVVGGGSSHRAPIVVATPPVPVTLDLLERGGWSPDLVRPGDVDLERLLGLRYHRVIALLATTDGPAALDPAGAHQRSDGPFSFIADNQRKGISPQAACVTFHTDHALSAELFDLDDDQVTEQLVSLAQAELGAVEILDARIVRWAHAGPVEPWPDRTAVLSHEGGCLVLAGDAFGGPKVEGAFRSGLAAGEAALAA